MFRSKERYFKNRSLVKFGKIGILWLKQFVRLEYLLQELSDVDHE